MDTDNKTQKNAAPQAGSLPTPKMRRGLKGFFAETARELKKVTWPPYKEVNRLTGVVLGVCALVVITLTVMSLVVGTGISALSQGK